MTVQTTSNKAGPFTGNGLVVIFQTGFRVDQPSDLQVIFSDSAGNESILDPGTYAATGFGNPTGIRVTYPVSGLPISVSEKITLLRLVNYDQQTSITNQGGFYPTVIERALDRIVFQCQQLAEKVARSVALPVSTALSSPLFPAPSSGKFLRSRADGTGWENADITGAGSIGLPVVIGQGGTGATSAAQARANLGLASGAITTVGTVAALNVGIAANNIPQLDGNAKLPAVDGSQLINLSPMKNLIINGSMDVAQRGTSFSTVSANQYTLDRWLVGSLGTAVHTVTQQADIPPSNEFQNSLRVTVATADNTISVTDVSAVMQMIEGYNIRHLIGQAFTLSWWVRSSKTGIHCVSFANGNGGTPDRSYVIEYSINVANTWEKKSLTIPAGLVTAGNWNYTNGIGLFVRFALAAGSNYQTIAGAWNIGNLVATSNQVNCLDTVGNIFAITGVQLELGSQATSFEHRSFAQELSLCQRYFQQVIGGVYIPSISAATQHCANTPVPIPMRAFPTVTQTSVAGLTSFPATGTLTVVSSGNALLIQDYRNSTGSGAGNWNSRYDLTAEL